LAQTSAMDLSSIDQSSDSGADTDNDGDELIPVAVPVAAVITRPHDDDDDDDDDSDAEGDDDEGGDVAGGRHRHDASFDAGGDEETRSHATDVTPPPSSRKRSNSEVSDNPATDSGKKKRYNDGRPRQPAAKGLTIPFRTIKRIMKIDTDIGIVQNDAAIVATAALELFVKDFATKSLEIAKRKGRNTIKYDDVAEVRANDRSLGFLDLLLP